MKARVRMDTDAIRPGSSAWVTMQVPDPPPAHISIPVVDGASYGAYDVDLIAVEHGVAVYV